MTKPPVSALKKTKATKTKKSKSIVFKNINKNHIHISIDNSKHTKARKQSNPVQPKAGSPGGASHYSTTTNNNYIPLPQALPFQGLPSINNFFREEERNPLKSQIPISQIPAQQIPVEPVEPVKNVKFKIAKVPKPSATALKVKVPKVKVPKVPKVPNPVRDEPVLTEGGEEEYILTSKKKKVRKVKTQSIPLEPAIITPNIFSRLDLDANQLAKGIHIGNPLLRNKPKPETYNWYDRQDFYKGDTDNYGMIPYEVTNDKVVGDGFENSMIPFERIEQKQLSRYMKKKFERLENERLQKERASIY